MKTIQIEFGKAGMHQIISENSTLDVYILDKIVQHLKEQGYNETKIGRLIFEEALDWTAKLTATQVADYIKMRKSQTGKTLIPKQIPVKLNFNHKEYDE